MANNYITDLSSYYNSTNAASRASSADVKTAKSSGYDLTMEDFLQLMMVELQNQTIDDTADTSEMLNQMVQMQMVTALSNMTDTNIMTYASSLVGKEVTIGVYDDTGLQEHVITVIGTGMLNGYQVIFGSDGKTYPLNQIMAVGRLPESEDGGVEKPGEGGDTENPGDVEKPGEGGDVEKPGEGGDTENPGDVEKPGEGGDVEKPGEGGDTTETPDVPDDRPSEGTGDTEDSAEEKKDNVVEPTQEVG